MRIRTTVLSSDGPAIEALLRATGFFNDEEVAIAMELVADRLANGEASHYRFVIGEERQQPVAYACWGPIPGTVDSADLYWIAVHPQAQGRGAGKAILATVERWIAEAGRRRIWVETATRPQYQPTRAFYARCGYRLVAELPDYYAPGDGKAILLKVLDRGG